MKTTFSGTFAGKTILITGHTGFKGSWLSLWLKELGANVIGYSLAPPTTPNHFSISQIEEGITSFIGDIRDYQNLKKIVDNYQPEIVFHLAAQPIVLQSYAFPKDTFDINTGGTVNILEAARLCPSVKALLMITSDKCYDNKEWIWGYREEDALGGKDPYSASKSMAEVAIASYRASFENHLSSPAIASARAGNVFGGGDFSEMRIIPDSIRALMAQKTISLRNPYSTRPWLHVLDCLSGYLSLAAELYNKGTPFASAWNFGPLEQQAVNVHTLVEMAIKFWGKGDWQDVSLPDCKHEMGLLKLNWDKAANGLKWRPSYNWIEALSQTIHWFKSYDLHQKNTSSIDMHEISLNHLHAYIDHAEKLQQPWTCIKSHINELHNLCPKLVSQ